MKGANNQEGLTQSDKYRVKCRENFVNAYEYWSATMFSQSSVTFKVTMLA